MHIIVTDDPKKIREIKARHFESGNEFHLVPILEFPEEGLEKRGWDDVCFQILKSGNRVVICGMEFAEHIERMKKKMDECGQHLSEAVRKSGATVNELAKSFKFVTYIDVVPFISQIQTSKR